MKTVLRRTIQAVLIVSALGWGIDLRAQACPSSPPIPPDWKAGDVFVGIGGGQVEVFRPSTNCFVDNISDGISNPGPANGSFSDNTWHLLTSDPGASVNQSKIARFTILPATVNGSEAPQTVLQTFDASSCSGGSSTGIQGISIDGQGNIFAANASPPNIVELDPTKTPPCQRSFPLSPFTSIGSFDLNSGATTAYFTSGGAIGAVNLSTSAVSSFLSFTGSTKLFDIRVVPAGTSVAGSTLAFDDLLVVAQGTSTFCTASNGVSAKSCVLLIDTNSKAVVTKYAIANQNSLQSLTLDPIVHDCTLPANCTSSLPAPTLNFFWVAPPSNQFFKVDTSSGSATGFSAGSGAVISSLWVYSGFGANAAIPTQFSGTITPDANGAVFNFDSNTLTASEYTCTGCTPLPSSTNVTVFAAAIEPSGGSADANQKCTQTADGATDCVVWEVESLPLPASDQFFSMDLLPPAGTGDNNTRVFRDEAKDLTISLDYTICCKQSLYSLNQITSPDEGCHYIPTTQFFDGATINANRNSITFRFQCDSLPGAQLMTLQNCPLNVTCPPRISIVQLISGQAPDPFFPNVATLVGGTCCTIADYRYDTSSNTWVINVSFKGVVAGARFNATTFIDSQLARAFDINFTFGGS
jgi:hypothetical protein